MIIMELFAAAKRPEHPSQRGFWPVIKLAVNHYEAGLPIGYFVAWATPSGKILGPDGENALGQTPGLRFGGYHLHTPNVGALSVNPREISSHGHGALCYPLPAPIIVTRDGDWDRAPLIANALAWSIWKTAASCAPAYGDGAGRKYWPVEYEPLETNAPKIAVIAMLHDVDQRQLVEKVDELIRHRDEAMMVRLRALQGRGFSTLNEELGWYA